MYERWASADEAVRARSLFANCNHFSRIVDWFCNLSMNLFDFNLSVDFVERVLVQAKVSYKIDVSSTALVAA